MATTTASDTPAHVARLLADGYRRMSASEKLDRVLELNRAVEAMATARLRKRYGPDERELRLRLAALRIPRSLMVAAFGWDPEHEGY